MQFPRQDKRRTAIIVIGLDQMERVFILDVFIKRIAPDPVLDQALAFLQAQPNGHVAASGT